MECKNYDVKAHACRTSSGSCTCGLASNSRRYKLHQSKLVFHTPLFSTRVIHLFTVDESSFRTSRTKIKVGVLFVVLE